MNWVNYTRSRNIIHENTGSVLAGGAILSADWNTSPWPAKVTWQRLLQ